VDRGSFARTINVPLQPFKLIGATTRAGFLSAPLRERFGLYHHFEFYPEEDLLEIARRSAKLLAVPTDPEALAEVARRSRGTPRVTIRLMRRMRDFAQVKGDGRVTPQIAREALAMEAVDERGLDELDRKFLRTIVEVYGGGPAGIEAIAATLNEEVDTLVDMVEPYLLKIGFVGRTRQGRIATADAYKHLGLKAPPPPRKSGKRGPPEPELFAPGTAGVPWPAARAVAVAGCHPARGGWRTRRAGAGISPSAYRRRLNVGGIPPPLRRCSPRPCSGQAGQAVRGAHACGGPAPPFGLCRGRERVWRFCGCIGRVRRYNTPFPGRGGIMCAPPATAGKLPASSCGLRRDESGCG